MYFFKAWSHLQVQIFYLMIKYASIATKAGKGYSIKNTTDDKLIEKDIRSFALPSGSNWNAVTSYRSVKVSRLNRRDITVSLSIILSEKDDSGRKGVLYTNVAVLKSRFWLSQLRKNGKVRDLIHRIFNDFPFTSTKLDIFWSEWFPPKIIDISIEQSLLHRMKVLTGRRIILKGETLSNDRWEGQFADHIFGIAKFAASYHKFVSFTTLTLNKADSSQIIAIPKQFL